MATVLLVVDMQIALLDKNPYNRDDFLYSIETLVVMARSQGVEICYIQHDGGKGDELEKGTPGWQLVPDITPAPDEKVFDKRFNSAFKDTGLHNYLQLREVDSIILVGMQTEYCIDATCKSAYDLGYLVTIPCDCTTTFDNDYLSGEKLTQFYEREIWKNRFASVIPITQVMEVMAD